MPDKYVIRVEPAILGRAPRVTFLMLQLDGKSFKGLMDGCRYLQSLGWSSVETFKYIEAIQEEENS